MDLEQLQREQVSSQLWRIFRGGGFLRADYFAGEDYCNLCDVISSRQE